ncbi:MAG: hypothetical protein HYY04_15100, partial [Chloroflexi bacterium]|nr:hypothetical protein [Chloroflexota bacterium]
VAPSPRRPFAPSLLWGQAGWERTFTLLWVLPSLLVFTLGHIGQPGYVLLPVPVAYLVLAALLADFEGPRRPSLLSVAILLVAANVGATLGTTELAYQIVPSFAARVDIRENDRYWERLQQLVERYPPAETVVLTGATPRSSFRHAGYYLTEYRVYAIGYDLVGTYGWLFRSYARVSDYHVGGLARSSPSVELPAGARYVFILDEDIAQSLARPYGSVVRQITPHRVVYSVEATGLSGIAFAGDQMHLVSRVLVEAPRSSVTP